MKDVDNDVYYGVKPLLKKERIYSFWDILLATGAWSIATWCYVQGGQIAELLGFKEGLISTICGIVLAGVIVYLTVIIPTRHGIDIWIYLRAVFGNIGVSIIALLCLAGIMGYFAINADIFASSFMNLLGYAGVSISTSWTPWIATTSVLIGMMIALKGPMAVKTSTRIMVPCLLAIGVFIVFTVFSHFSFSDLASMDPLVSGKSANTVDYMLVTEWNIAFVLAWFCSLGVLARLVKTERASYWGHMAGFSGIMAMFICIGIMTALAMYAATGTISHDPTDWLVELGGPALGSISLIFIIIANITTQGVGVYSFAVSTKVMKPDLKFSIITIFWSGWTILLIFWGGIWEYYEVLLAVLGTISGSACALILADFYIVRKQKFSMRGLYQIDNSTVYKYTKGFNIPAFISFALGIFSYFLVYDPINAVPRSDLFQYTTATGLCMLVCSVTYILLSKIKPLNNYLRKDVKEEDIKEDIKKSS
ncbi:purine-cytosine permease family protein [Lentibacillus salinarum]|uniref:Purine-cytosine permease family protein n=1 Tax=Lentibacillus salinarum TaxID=446820 RepID=A0ABW3ZYM0_9BACI